MRILALALIVCAPLIAQNRTILAIGAHAGDMELTAGAVLAHQAKKGDRIVLLHLSPGEAGHPTLSPQEYGDQKRREGAAAAKALGAEVIFAPFTDGLVRRTDTTVRYVAEMIRTVKPQVVITHWKNSMHPDHSETHVLVKEAVLLAALRTFDSKLRIHRGVRLYYADNWEDAEGFQPYLFIDVSADVDTWKDAVGKYAFVTASSFAYMNYYEGLFRTRGALAGKKFAEAFDIDPESKKRVADALP